MDYHLNRLHKFLLEKEDVSVLRTDPILKMKGDYVTVLDYILLLKSELARKADTLYKLELSINNIEMIDTIEFNLPEYYKGKNNYLEYEKCNGIIIFLFRRFF